MDCPSVADKRFQDLRDTAVTRLALAGCELPKIAAITVHSLTSITAIIKHYPVLQPAMADAAIAKLSAWLAAQRSHYEHMRQLHQRLQDRSMT
jgi:hypothetical protein